MTVLGFKEHMMQVLGKKVDVLEYPIKKENLFYDNFKLGKVIKVYG
jgi:hypothetical protein